MFHVCEKHMYIYVYTGTECLYCAVLNITKFAFPAEGLFEVHVLFFFYKWH